MFLFFYKIFSDPPNFSTSFFPISEGVTQFAVRRRRKFLRGVCRNRPKTLNQGICILLVFVCIASHRKSRILWDFLPF